MSLSRRAFLMTAAAPAILRGAALTSKQRVDRALLGQDVDRPPFTLWHHFKLEKEGPARHAQATIEYHKKFRTDLVKVMSDFPYPKPAGNWWEAKVEQNPFPEQLKALDFIRQGVGAEAYFLETIFNPWKVAENLSSPQEVLKLKNENPQRLLDVLKVIAQSEANHARKAIAAGASGIFLAIANAQTGILTPAEYAKFSEPFDRQVLQAVSGAKLNTLHLHGDKVYLDHFYKPWPAIAINYSTAGTGVTIATVRSAYSGVIIGGLDEKEFRKLDLPHLMIQYTTARKGAGKKFILAPGCSVPDDSTDEEQSVVRQLVS
jgi:uroporphyrinogen decarboxylase